jgi:hypothetical protein
MTQLEVRAIPKDLYYHEVAYVRRLEAVEAAARDLIKTGLALRPGGLTVVEKADKSDPHYRLCDALEAIAPLNPK